MGILRDILLFLLVLVGSHIIWRVIPFLLTAGIWYPLGVVDRRRGVDRKPAFFSFIARVDAIAIGAIATVLLVGILVTANRTLWISWILHPVLPILVLATMTLLAPVKSHLSYLRQMISFLRIASVPLALYALVRILWPTALSPALEYWAAVAGIGLIPPMGVWTLIGIVPAIRHLHEIDAQHTVLAARTKQAGLLVKYISHSVDRRNVIEALAQGEAAQNAALHYIRSGEQSGATAALIHGRLEIDHVEQLLLKHLPAAARDKLISEFAEAFEEIKELRREFGDAGLDQSILDVLDASLREQEDALANLPDSLDQIDAWAQPVWKQLRTVVDLRTALRFYRNSGDTIDGVVEQLALGERLEHVGGGLGCDIGAVSATRKGLTEALSTFRKGKFSDYMELVLGYVAIQNGTAKYRREIADVSACIERGWIHLSPLGLVHVYVPKAIQPHNPSNVLIQAIDSEASASPVKIVADGTLLELPGDCDRELGPESRPWVLPIAGKRSGSATLTLRISDGGRGYEDVGIAVTVVATTSEIITHSALAAALGGAIAGGAFWLCGIPVDDAMQNGAIAGGLLAGFFLIVKFRIVQVLRK